MTVSFTPYCRSAPDPLPPRSQRGLLPSLLAWLACLWFGAAFAAELEVKSASVGLGEDGYVLNAEFRAELSPRLEDVVSRGVPLYLAAEFELKRPRWYWFDEKVASRTQTYRLSYHALTRQYRLSTGALHQNFPSLEDALGVVSRIRDLPVADKGALKPGESYEAQLRLHVDLSQLPKPLQVTAIGDQDWSVGSDWHRWSYTVPEREAK